MSNAPYCPVSHSQTKVTVQPPGADIDSVSRAHDLRSVITAINRMNSVVQHITRGQPQINNIGSTTINFAPEPQDRQPPPAYPRMTWKEIDRDYHSDEIVNPDDESQKIEIKTIQRIIWQEEVTEHRVVYNGRSQPNYK